MGIIQRLIKRFALKKNNELNLNIFNSIFSELSHDLKNNLITIRTCIYSIKAYLNPNKLSLTSVEKTLSIIDKKINHTATLLNMVYFITCPRSSWPKTITTCSILNCIHNAFQQYPFISEKYVSLIKLEESAVDFLFAGNEELLSVVFYCLIRNAIISLNQGGQGQGLIQTIHQGSEGVVKFTYGHTKSRIKSKSHDVYDLFLLGDLHTPLNGLNFIQQVMQHLQGDVILNYKPHNLFCVTLMFKILKKDSA